ncbi:MAG TPA: AAA family ATPase [Malonomonas sp.]
MSEQTDNRLIHAMQKPSCYDHPVTRVELIETHISWIFLAGDYAYKVKKPVNFGFLDFSTLEKRQHYCLEELRLNRRFAPQLYLDVVVIGGNPLSPRLHSRPALEYAVKMRRFEQSAQLDRLLDAGELSAKQINQFAVMLAEIHKNAPVASKDAPFGSPAAIRAPIEENFKQIRPLLPATEHPQLKTLELWSLTELKRLRELLMQRKAAGFIRECHGDIHLANIAWFDAQPLLFDCIEFNENLRWIDVISDSAFLLMDLDDRGEAKLGWCFLNRYLQESGDYQGLQLLRCYKVYRALVRAKVLCLRLAQAGLNSAEHAEDLARYHGYLQLAESYTTLPARALIITQGLSGSGKSSVARLLAEELGAIHLQSDRERKRLYGLAANADSSSTVAGGIYSASAHEATYAQLQKLAETVLAAGYPVIVDATFLLQAQRDCFRLLSERLQVPLIILAFSVPEAELRRRIQQRSAAGTDVSEANLQVLDLQLASQQPLNQVERQLTLNITPETNIAEIGRLLTERLFENISNS